MGLRIHIEILDENNDIVGEHFADASTPSAWNAPSGKPLLSKMPQNSDNENSGTFELFRLTVQPVVRVSRPNGWKEPVPSPLTGIAPGQGKPLYDQKPTPWGMGTPTKPAAPTQSIGLVPTRGY
jgi:hypothetical protein